MKVSVLCITYNHELFIREAIESFLMQQCNFDFEIIIGEDKSSDYTASICEEYAQLYPDKIKLVCNDPNLGMSPNFVKTFERCTGEYIALCEGDDYWTDPKKLQKQIDFLDDNLDFNLCFHAAKTDKKGIIAESDLNTNQKETTTINDLQYKNYIQTCTVVFRNIFKLPTWFKSAMPGDFPLFLLATGKFAKIRFLDIEMANYRMHEGGIWSMQDRSDKIVQYTATLYNSFNELNLDKKIASNHILLAVADNIYLYGFKYMSVLKYLFYCRKLYVFGNFNFRQKAFILTCYIRHIFKGKSSTVI